VPQHPISLVVMSQVNEYSLFSLNLLHSHNSLAVVPFRFSNNERFIVQKEKKEEFNAYSVGLPSYSSGEASASAFVWRTTLS
jgi:hypothetical protein